MAGITLKRYNGSSWDSLEPVADWNTLLNKPSTFAPTTHGDSAHSEVYSKAEPEWEFIAKATDSASSAYILVDSTDLGEAFNWTTYDYKFVAKLETTGEDTSQPYITFNGTTGAVDYYASMYTRVQMSAELTETVTHVGDEDANTIDTGVALNSSSINGAVTRSEIEFIVTRGAYALSGMYLWTVKGSGMANYGTGQTSVGNIHNGMCLSNFMGSIENNTGITSVVLYHDITIGNDYNTMQIYKRKKY